MKKMVVLAAAAVLAGGALADPFIWGSTQCKNFKVKTDAQWKYFSSSAYGRAYLYLGTGKIVNGKFDISELTFLEYSDPASSFTFGWCYNGATKDSQLTHMNDAVDAAGGQAYTIVIVGKSSASEKLKPQLTVGDRLYTMAIINGVSTSRSVAETGTKYASLVSDVLINAAGQFTDNVEIVKAAPGNQVGVY